MALGSPLGLHLTITNLDVLAFNYEAQGHGSALGTHRASLALFPKRGAGAT